MRNPQEWSGLQPILKYFDGDNVEGVKLNETTPIFIDFIPTVGKEGEFNATTKDYNVTYLIPSEAAVGANILSALPAVQMQILQFLFLLAGNSKLHPCCCPRNNGPANLVAVAVSSGPFCRGSLSGADSISAQHGALRISRRPQGSEVGKLLRARHSSHESGASDRVARH